ncbi:MAG: ATP-binding cassette domain-containing protein [Candidatus Acetothermia bacterium]
MLRAQGLIKYYGSEEVLAGVDLALEREEIRGFLGPNGAGKTTTFKLLAGAEGYSQGTIRLDGRKLDGLPIHLRARRGLTFLPQETSLFRGLTARENVEVYLKGPRADAADSERDVERALERLNSRELGDRKASKLSSGQGRKIEIARALALSPSYLLLDEPFSDLDPRSVAEIKEILVSLTEEEGVGIMISDHRAREALSITDHNYLIKAGRIIAEGDSEEITGSEVARESYFVN